MCIVFVLVLVVGLGLGPVLGVPAEDAGTPPTALPSVG
jgi:hypothetical protein